jgi:23S rRNA (adenine-N6)-dimethyltransferase
MKHQPPKRQQDEIRFTQNFLRDPALVAELVSQAGIRSGETVLEIGPGKGIITKALAQAVGISGRVIAVELDTALSVRLREQFSSTPQVKIAAGNILEFDRASIVGEYKAFANVPFNITSALLEYLFADHAGLTAAHLILQTDAVFGTGERGLKLETFKSLLIKPLYTIDISHHFKQSDFVPSPGVDTALFRFERRTAPLINPAQYDLYKDFLAFVSKDRVGEGVWLRVLSRQQLRKLEAETGIVIGRGIKTQSADALAAAFRLFSAGDRAKHKVVSGAMDGLRAEQAHRETINRTGGHRRPRRP